MSVFLAGRLVQTVDQLSPLARLSLTFIDGGLEWLAWAIAEHASRHDFADEAALVGQVQSGLHGSPFVLLPQLALKVSPIKLLTLGLPSLQLLARAEGGDDGAALAAQVHQVLADHELATQADLALGTTLLAALGVAALPLFHAMDFGDHLALWQLARALSPSREPAPALQREAADFAVRQARTPIEFCDYLRVYLDGAAHLAPASPEQRRATAEASLNGLLPLLFGTLDGPRIDGLPSPSDVGRAVSNWLDRGKQVGFASLSQAVRQIVQHTPCQGETADAPRAVRLYLQSAQAFLVANPPVRGRLGQDGATCLYPITSGSLRAELQVGASGVVSLSDFASLPVPATAPKVLMTTSA